MNFEILASVNAPDPFIHLAGEVNAGKFPLSDRKQYYRSRIKQYCVHRSP